MNHHANICLVIAVFSFALATLLRLLICLKAIDLRLPIDGVFVAFGLTMFSLAFLVT